MLTIDPVLQVLQNESLIHLDVSSGQISYYNAQPSRRDNKKRAKRNAETKESLKRRCVEISTPKVVIDLDPTPNKEELANNDNNEIEVILETTVPESNELPVAGSSVWFLEIEHLLKQNEQPSPSPSPVKSSQKNTKPAKRRSKNSKRQLFGESELFPIPSSISASPPLSPSSLTRLDFAPSFTTLGAPIDEEFKRQSLAGAFDSFAHTNSLPSLPPLGNLYSSLASLNMLSNPAAFSALSTQSSLYPLLASPFGLPSYPFVSPFYYGPSLMYFNNFQASQ